MTENVKQKNGKVLHIAVFGKRICPVLSLFLMDCKCVATEPRAKITKQCNKSARRILFFYFIENRHCLFGHIPLVLHVLPYRQRKQKSGVSRCG